MDRVDLTGATWIKSSRSNGQSACVEVVIDAPVVPVRDSKDPHGPTLVFSAEAWSTFIDTVKAGHYR
ncbi:DUF397 domain-containing protein [Streptomyces sp. NPDC020096]